MAVTEDLIVKVQADTSKAVASIDLMNHSLEAIQDSLKVLSQTSQRSEKSLNGFGGAAVKLNQALELAKKGFTLIFEPLKDMVKQFQAGQDEITRLGKTLQLMGNRDVNGTVKHFMELADQLKENTTVEDELVISLARVGSTLDLTTAQIDKMIETAIDMAAVTGGSVEQAFQGLVNTLRGNARGAGDLAILLQDLTREELEAGKGVDILNAKLKGMAKSEAGTSVGKLIIIMRELGDLGKDIGKILSEGLGLGSAGTDALEMIKSIRKELESIKPAVVDVITFIRALVSGLVAAFKGIDFTLLIESLFRLGINVLTLTAYLTPFAALIGAVYLSFSTLGPAVLLTSKSMLAMSAATAAAAAKFLILGSAIAVGAVALDFWIANMERTGDVIGLFVANIRVGLIGIFADIFEKMGWDTLAGYFREKSKELVDYTEKVGDGLVDGALVEGIKQAGNAIQGFGKGFDEVADSAYTAQNSVQQFADGTGEAGKKIKGMTEEGKKLIQELANTVAKLGKELSEVGASEGQKIALNNEERIRELGLLEQKLIKERAFGPLQQEQLKNAIAISNAISAKQASELKKKNLKEEIDRTKELANQIMDMNATTMDRIQMEKQAGLDAIAKRREELALDKEINKEALDQLDAQEALLKMKADMASEKAPNADFESAQMDGGNLGNQVAKAFQGPISGMLAGAGAFADAIQGLIDFVPQMLDKITGIFTSLTELPGKILEGVSKLGDALLKFVADFIPNVINMVPKLLEKFIQFFANLPDVFANLLAGLPDMLSGILDRLPELVESFVLKLTQAAPKIIISLLNFLVKKAPWIAIELAKALAIEIPMAIINGIIEAIKSLPKMFKELGKGIIPKPSEIAKNFALGLKTVTKTLTGVASKLFAVMDLEDGAKAGGDKLAEFAKTAEDAVNDSIEKLGNGAGDAWQGLIDAWRWVYDNIILPIFNGLKAVWEFVYNTILKPIINAIREVWLFVYNTFILPFVELLRTVWGAMMKSLEAVWGIVQSIWTAMMNVLTAVWDTLMVVFQATFNVVKAIWDGMMAIFTSAWDMVKNIWNILMDLFQGKINIFDAVFKIGGEILGHVTDVFKEVFKVAEVMFKGVTDIFLSVFKTIQTYLQGAADVFMSVFKYISTVFNGLADIGTKIWDNLAKGLQGIGGIFAKAFNELNPIAIFEKIFKVDSGAFGNKGTVEKALGIDLPFMSFARGGKVPGNSMMPGDSLLNDKILALLSPGEVVIPRSVLADPAMKKLVEAMLSGQKIPQFAGGGAIGKLGRDAKKTYDEKIAPVIEPVLEPIVQAVENVIPDLNPAQMWEQVKDMVANAVMKIFESNKFHNGGEVPAMLKPGEFVMNNGAVDRVGTGFLDNLNRGGGAEKETTINNVINLTINTTQPMDEAFIKAKVYPVVRDQIKRASIDGQTLVYAPGVRNA
jgi:phage-related protein